MPIFNFQRRSCKLSFSMLRSTFHATPEKICARGLLKWSSKSWVSAVSKQQFLQSSKRSKTFKRMSLSLPPLLSTSAVCGFLALLFFSSIQKSSWRDQNVLLPVWIHRNVWQKPVFHPFSSPPQSHSAVAWPHADQWGRRAFPSQASVFV